MKQPRTIFARHFLQVRSEDGGSCPRKARKDAKLSAAKERKGHKGERGWRMEGNNIERRTSTSGPGVRNSLRPWVTPQPSTILVELGRRAELFRSEQE